MITERQDRGYFNIDKELKRREYYRSYIRAKGLNINISEVYQGNLSAAFLRDDNNRIQREISLSSSSGDPVPVTGVRITSVISSFRVGMRSRIIAVVTPFNASNKKVRFVSSDPSVVSIDSLGNIEALKVGTVMISVRAEEGSFVSYASIDVLKVIDSVTISDVPSSLKVGDSVSLSVSITPLTASDKRITWSSSDETILTVDNNGVITAVGIGTASITAAYTADPSIKSVASSVRVTQEEESAILVSQVTITDKSVTTLEVEESLQLNAEVLPIDASNKTLEWSSSNEDAILVDEDGLVKAIYPASGTITVKATDGSNVQDSIDVIALGDKAAIHRKKIVLNIEGTKELDVSFDRLVSSTNTAPPVFYTFSSSDPQVALVNANTGVVTGVKAGEAVITARTAGNDAYYNRNSVRVKVIADDIEPKYIWLGKGKTFKLPAGVYTSSDTSIATVNADGLVTAMDKEGLVSLTKGDAMCYIVVGMKEFTLPPLAETGIEVGVGKTYELVCILPNEDSYFEMNSSDDSVATIEDGYTIVLTGKEGTVKINNIFQT